MNDVLNFFFFFRLLYAIVKIAIITARIILHLNSCLPRDLIIAMVFGCKLLLSVGTTDQCFNKN